MITIFHQLVPCDRSQFGIIVIYQDYKIIYLQDFVNKTYLSTDKFDSATCRDVFPLSAYT